MNTQKTILLVFFTKICIAQNVGINTTGAAPASTNLLEVLSPSTTISSVAVFASHTGAVAGTGYAIRASKTGASTTNIAGEFTASGATTNTAATFTTSGAHTTNTAASFASTGATNNYAIIVPASSGNVGIGLTAPSSILHVSGAIRTGIPSGGLGGAAATNGSLIFNNSSNSNTLTINTGATTSSYSLTFPASQGASSSVLTNDGSGNLSWGGLTSTSSTTGIGYATGAGGTITQLTSKSTGVTINKICGKITMHNEAVALGAERTFTVTNSTVAATDVPIVSIASGGTSNSYLISVTAVAAGSFDITISNASGGLLGEALVINFAIIKSVTN